MIGRLLRSVDFERVLRTRSRASSAHFAVHHLADRPSTSAARKPLATDLSTAPVGMPRALVDDLLREPQAEAAPIAVDKVWFGAVVPKRHARRAVTRTLLKRQIRSVVAERPTLTAGLWVVRLRAPFDRQLFPSAASDALKRLARSELEQVLARAAERPAAR